MINFLLLSMNNESFLTLYNRNYDLVYEDDDVMTDNNAKKKKKKKKHKEDRDSDGDSRTVNILEASLLTRHPKTTEQCSLRKV